MNIEITVPMAADKTDWQRLYRQYAQFYKQTISTQTLDTVWSWLMSEQGVIMGLLAKEQGKTIALLHYRAMPSPLRGQMVGFVDDIFVDPDFRGKQVSTLLLAHLKAIGKKQQWPFIRWITAKDNYHARFVYDKLADKTNWRTYQMKL